jgi:hypothetical protein
MLFGTASCTYDEIQSLPTNILFGKSVIFQNLFKMMQNGHASRFRPSKKQISHLEPVYVSSFFYLC